MKHALHHIHFVGIGGAGMSGIAEILHRMGYRVSGSDQHDSATLRALAAIGIAVAVGHDSRHADGADALVVSGAVPGHNPEVNAARARGVPVVPRAEMLAELMRTKRSVAVAGTHGKTTTTSLITAVLIEAGVDPSFVIGGKLLAAGVNARLGQGEALVAEADESDASFLKLFPVLAVVTNIDADHLGSYGHSIARLQQAFVDFVGRLPFYGVAVVCADDPGVQAVLPRLSRRALTYGLGEGAMWRAVGLQALAGGRMRFTVRRQGGSDLDITLNLAGEHNVRNALAAVVVAAEFGVPDAAVQAAFEGFRGVGRRFERHGELPSRDGGRFTLIDDYGHHPAEIAAVLAAARGAFPGRAILLAFQPHRYTRTRDCFDGFVAVLKAADCALLAEVYPAGEAPIEGADSQALARALALPPPLPVEQLAQAIIARARGGDVVLTMGAGSIGDVPQQLLQMAETP
jgi:UDP-N-acetylmuramate--alanine ligase